jgi:hypothetical protein
MMGLTISVASNQQWDVAGQQLLYSLVFFVLLYLVELNAYSLDAVLSAALTAARVNRSRRGINEIWTYNLRESRP